MPVGLSLMPGGQNRRAIVRSSPNIAAEIPPMAAFLPEASPLSIFYKAIYPRKKTGIARNGARHGAMLNIPNMRVAWARRALITGIGPILMVLKISS